MFKLCQSVRNVWLGLRQKTHSIVDKFEETFDEDDVRKQNEKELAKIEHKQFMNRMKWLKAKVRLTEKMEEEKTKKRKDARLRLSYSEEFRVFIRQELVELFPNNKSAKFIVKERLKKNDISMTAAEIISTMAKADESKLNHN